MLHVILLSGGSGKRLWPLSNDMYSKQFIRLFRLEDGTYESMMMRAYRGLLSAGADRITIATEKNQVSAIRRQLGEEPDLCVEPCRRDTFPAIALAAARIRERGGSGSDPVVICPVDAYVEKEYYAALLELGRMAADPGVRLALMGVEPTEPSDKFGYILPEGAGDTCRASAFFEKPDPAKAASLIRSGALWNSGAFAFRLEYILEKSRELLGTAGYAELEAGYESLPRISFDYAVAEAEKDIRVTRFRGVWKDIGTWSSLTEVLEAPVIGPALTDDCENVSVINHLSIPLVCMGIKDTVVCASPDGILISGKEASAGLKAFAESLEREPRYAEQQWGAFEVLAADTNSLTRQIAMQPGNRIRYHAHRWRDESWFVTAGTGEVLIDGDRRQAGPGSVFTFPRGTRHRMLALEELILIEVQMGDCFNPDDRQFFPEDDAAV